MEIKGLYKSYGSKKVYENFDFFAEEGKITAILGESGSGKTTLLNIIAGLTDYAGEVVGAKRPASCVFQTDRLVPNLTAEENVRLVCANADVSSAFERVGLKGKEKLRPKDLSAGMKRRVAIVRALLFDSPLILMDEPFINLDVALKFSVMDYIKEEAARNSRTLIAVTHDVKEAAYLADRTVILSRGEIIFDEPKNEDSEERLFRELMKIKPDV